MKFNSLTKVILVILLWCVCIFKIYLDYDHEYLMDSLIHNGLIIIASIVSAFAINSDYRQYKLQKKLTSFFATVTALVGITALLLTTYFLRRQDKIPSILYATKNTQGLSSISIDFRANNTYKLGVHHFMSTDYARGHYTKKDSIFYLDEHDIPEQITSDKFLLRTIPMSDSVKKKKQNGLLTLLFGRTPVDTTPETFLFQMSDKGQIIDTALSFKVVDRQFD